MEQKLEKMSFLQEGHRLDFLNPNDASSNLIYKGVVYNEMKGSMANPDNILMQKIFENLMPDLPYSYNSGGDPKDIPNLTVLNFILNLLSENVLSLYLKNTLL